MLSKQLYCSCLFIFDLRFLNFDLTLNTDLTSLALNSVNIVFILHDNQVVLFFSKCIFSL